MFSAGDSDSGAEGQSPTNPCSLSSLGTGVDPMAKAGRPRVSLPPTKAGTGGPPPHLQWTGCPALSSPSSRAPGTQRAGVGHSLSTGLGEKTGHEAGQKLHLLPWVPVAL